jgi:hypothetical protein
MAIGILDQQVIFGFRLPILDFQFAAINFQFAISELWFGCQGCSSVSRGYYTTVY